MNSRQRLLASLNHEAVDRVPVSTYELVGYNSHSFENREPSYRRVMDAIREQSDCIAMWNPGSNENYFCSSHPVETTVERKRLESERINTTKVTIHTPKGDLTQCFNRIDDVLTNWQVEHLCKSSEDVDKALSVPWEPIEHDGSDFERIKAEVGDHGIVMASCADPLCLAADLMEFGEYTVWAMTETDHFAKTIDIFHERLRESLKSMLQAAPVDLVRFCGPEYATPPYLPPSYFQRFVTPYVKELVDIVHSFGVKARVHCHGRIGQVLDEIVATGADGVDPCEAPPDGDIELVDIKKRAGEDLCLFGNIQLKLLEAGTSDQVRAEVKKCMDSAKAGYGFVLMPTAAPINIPLGSQTEENYLAYLDAAHEFGIY